MTVNAQLPTTDELDKLWTDLMRLDGITYEGRMSRQAADAIKLLRDELAGANKDYELLLKHDLENVAELRAAKVEVNYLKEALEKYGEHDVDCALLGTHEPCSCGLDNILDAISKE